MTFARTSVLPSIIAGAATFVALASLWFVFPLWQRHRARARSRMRGTLPIGTRTAELRPHRPPH